MQAQVQLNQNFVSHLLNSSDGKENIELFIKKKILQICKLDQSTKYKTFTSNLCKTILSSSKEPLLWEIKKLYSEWAIEKQDKNILDKLCKISLLKNERAFICKNCMIDTNELHLCVMCENCFQESRHINHNFSQITIKVNTFCHCRSQEKWKEFQFCGKHKSLNKNQNIFFQTETKQQFLTFMTYAFQLLFDLNETCLKLKQSCKNLNNHDGLKKALHSVLSWMDFYGSELIQFLIRLSSFDQIKKQLVQILFINNPKFEELSSGQHKCTLLKKLFTLEESVDTFRKLNKLFNSCFDMSQFKKEVVLCFFQICKEIGFQNELEAGFKPMIRYAFSNHHIIAQIAELELFDPFQIKYPLLKHSKNAHDWIERVVATASKQYQCLSIISELPGNAGFIYLKYYFARRQAWRVASHRIQFKGMQVSRHKYVIEFSYLMMMIKCTKALVELDRRELVKPMKDLLRYIVSNEVQANDYYRSHQRTFILMLFAFLGGQFHELHQREVFQQVLQLLSFQTQNHQSIILTLINNAMTNLQNLAKDRYEGGQCAQLILRKDSLILSLDFIFIKFVFQLANYFSVDVTKYISMPFEKYLNQVKKSFDEKKSIRIFNKLLALIVEVFISDLPEVTIACLLDSSNPNQLFKSSNKFCDSSIVKKIYRELLSSAGNISIMKLEVIFKDFLFNEKLFKQFVETECFVDQNFKISLKVPCKTFNIMRYRSYKHRTRLEEISYSKKASELPFELLFSKSSQFIINHSKLIHYSLEMLNQIAKTFQTNFDMKNVYKNLTYSIWLTYYCFRPNIQLSNLYSLKYCIIEWECVQKQLKEEIQQFFGICQKRQPIKLIEEKHHQQNQIVIDQKSLQQRKKRNKMMEQTRMKSLQFLKNYESIESIQASVEKAQQISCLICKSSTNTKDRTLCYMCAIEETNLYGSLSLLGHHKFLKITVCNDQHLIHSSCSSKNLKFCPLCKKETNILVPVCQFQVEGEDQSIQITELMVNLFDKCFASSLLPRYSEIEIVKLLFWSIQTQILFSGFLNSHFFIKNILPIYKTIFSIMKFIVKRLNINQKYLKLMKLELKYRHDSNQFCIAAMQYVGLRLQEELCLKKDARQPHFSSIYLNKSSVDLLEQIIRAITCQEKQDQSQSLMQKAINESSLVAEIKKTFNIYQLPATLLRLYQLYKGKCKFCQRITDCHVLCILCANFTSCQNCQPKEYPEHCSAEHSNSGVLIHVSTGEINYYFEKRKSCEKSVYLNYKGDEFKLENLSEKREEYQLQPTLYKKVLQDILNLRISSKIPKQSAQIEQVD